MAEHLNAILVRKGYEAFGKGDTATLAELLADEIKWHTPKGNNPLSGDYSGKQEVMGFFGKFAELGIRVNFDFHDILANDDHVVVLANARAQREGKTYEGRAVHVWHVRDGKAAEFWGFTDNQPGWDAFNA